MSTYERINREADQGRAQSSGGPGLSRAAARNGRDTIIKRKTERNTLYGLYLVQPAAEVADWQCEDMSVYDPTSGKRRCTVCGVMKDPATDFSPNAAAGDGLQSYCRACHADARRKRYADSKGGREVRRYHRLQARQSVIKD